MNTARPYSMGSVCRRCGTYSRGGIASGFCPSCEGKVSQKGNRWLRWAAPVAAIVGVTTLALGLAIHRSSLGPPGEERFPDQAQKQELRPTEPTAEIPRTGPKSEGGRGSAPKVPPPSSSSNRTPKQVKGDAVDWANLGATAASQGRWREAEEAYQKALHLEPDNWLAHYNLGLLEVRRGNTEIAYRHWQRALSSLDRKDSVLAKEVRRQLEKEPACAGLRQEAKFYALVTR